MNTKKICIDVNILNKLTNKHRELAIYITCMLNPGITKEQIKDLTGICESYYKKSMKYLRDNGYIESIKKKDPITGCFVMQKIEHKTKSKPKKETQKIIEKTQEKIQLKIILKGGKYREITQEELTTYNTAYPAINVEKEIEKMNAWCFSNTEKRKTERGVKRFINSWLNRASTSNNHPVTDLRKRFENQPNRRLTPAEKCAIGCQKSLERLQESKGNDYF